MTKKEKKDIFQTIGIMIFIALLSVIVFLIIQSFK